MDEEQVGLCDALDSLQNIRGSCLLSTELINQSCLLWSSTEELDDRLGELLLFSSRANDDPEKNVRSDDRHRLDFQSIASFSSFEMYLEAAHEGSTGKARVSTISVTKSEVFTR